MENENLNSQNQEIEQDQQEQSTRQDQQTEKTFTQAEVDAIINKRIAKERKGQPTAEELSAYREWKKSQQSPDERQAATQAERDSALAEAEIIRRENYLLRQGIDPDDVDYYVYKISKTMDDDTDFEDAAKAFLKEHKPRNNGSGVRVDLMGRLNGNGGKKTDNQIFNDLIRNARK